MKHSSPARAPFTILWILFLFVATPVAFSQAPADSGVTNPDSLNADRRIEEIQRDVRQIKEHVAVSPLGNRNWGVEIDPLYLLFIDEGGGLSATVSNFSLNRSAELAFPIFWVGKDKESILNLDAHYRYFLSGIQRGFYVSGFLRYQHQAYQAYDDSYYYNEEIRTLNRAGLGFGIGYRIFSRRGIYWGWSFSVGRFLASKEEEVSDVIVDAELLKIGFAF